MVKLISYKYRIHCENMLFLLPVLIFFVGIVLLPFIQGIPYSFTDWKSIINKEKNFVGFRNYFILITNVYFLQSLAHTFHFTILYIFFANVLGLAMALMLNRSSRFNNVARTITFMPFTVALTSAAIVWSYVYTDIYSPLFNVSSPLGLSSQVIPGMAVIAVWRDMGYCMLIYIAALQSIPSDYYEAAKVEGANYFQRLWHITLPMIVPAFTSNITLITAWGLRLFDYPMAVAKNMDAAQSTAMYVYDNIFGFNKAGLGQAAAIIITIILVLCTNVITNVLRNREVEV
ncbi:putative ABC transporter permease protein AmyD [Spirochaetia bacterium]|nr:putative ABC transporter permease protein AmyD [Spirochaetia bacterium]